MENRLPLTKWQSIWKYLDFEVIAANEREQIYKHEILLKGEKRLNNENNNRLIVPVS